MNSKNKTIILTVAGTVAGLLILGALISLFLAQAQTLSEEGEYPYPTLFSNITPENAESYYYKALSLNYTSGEWDISEKFSSSPVVFMIDDYDSIQLRQQVVISGVWWAYTCCNITKGDRLYTNDNGTLINLYNDNYNTRIYNVTSKSWESQKVGASTNPNTYNKRGALYQDATQAAWSMETVNVSTPTLIKILINS